MTSCGGLGKEILMPYPINQRAHQFNSIQSVPVSFGLWDTALKLFSPGPRSDVTDHLDILIFSLGAPEMTNLLSRDGPISFYFFIMKCDQ